MSTGALCVVISGTPGAGKTALAVSMLMDELERTPGRQVFVMGIPELAIPHEPVPPVAEWTVERPHPDDPTITYPEFVFPDGALVIIDEAQNAFRNRASSAKVPDHVAAMERHRHKGLDFWLLTQHPTMLDPNVRRLAGKHLHVRSLWSGGQLLEWPECSDPNSVSDRSRATVTKYSPPKRAFKLYKSSSKHVKRSRRVPFIAWAVGAALCVSAVLGWQVFQRVSGAIAGEPRVAASSSGAGSAQPGQKPVQSVGAGAAVVQVAGVGASPADYVPRIRSRPETAPMYDAIRVPRTMPVVAGGICMGDRCRCYTQQGTDAFLDNDVCRELVANPAFNPWAAPVVEAARATAGTPSSGPPSASPSES